MGDVGTQVEDERVEHARRELELHELAPELPAQLEGLRIAGTVPGNCGQRLRVKLCDRGEAARCLLRIGAGVDGFVAATVVVALFFVVAFFLGFGELHLGRILGLCDDIGGIRIDEPHDDVDQPRLAPLDRLVGFQEALEGRRIER